VEFNPRYKRKIGLLRDKDLAALDCVAPTGQMRLGLECPADLMGLAALGIGHSSTALIIGLRPPDWLVGVVHSRANRMLRSLLRRTSFSLIVITLP
jgi:hypothetical protein